MRTFSTGPWTINGYRTIFSNQKPIAQMLQCGPTNDKDIALICAAPDLIEALILVRDTLDKLELSSPSIDILKRVIHLTIGKALGEIS